MEPTAKPSATDPTEPELPLGSHLAALVAPPARHPLILAHPALLASASADHVRRHTAPVDPHQPLDTADRDFLHMGHRREHGLEVLRFPVLGCVLSGEADYRVADYVLTFKAGAFFIVPAGVPGPDGSRPHWERPDSQQAQSETVWLISLPSGAFVTSCRVEGGQHLSGRDRVFVPDSRLHALLDILIDELMRGREASEELARLYLRALVLRLERGLAAPLPPLAPLPHQSSTVVSPIVSRVIEHVDAHLHEPLTLAHLAAASHLSSPHLRRLFTAEVGTSVMRHVTARRMSYACQLLSQTELPVAEIARLVGFAYSAHFSRVFRSATGTSPGQYRAASSKEQNH